MRKLIVKGKEAAAVRVIPGMDITEKHAAEELIRYLGMMGIPEGDGLTVQVIIDESIGRDGYRVHIVDEDTLEIAGGNGRGVNYGVYRFLERYAGVRYFMPDLETLGEGDIIVDEDSSFVPWFEMRQSDWMCCRDANWYVKNGVNNCEATMAEDFSAEIGGRFRYAKGCFAHTMGKLAGTGVQPCVSDPEVLKNTIASVRKILADEQKEVILSITQEDGSYRCTCDKCMAVVEEEGSWSGLYLRFVNAVAADIAEDYPDAVIDTFAYFYSEDAPKITKPLPNVCIRLCAYSCCFSHAVDDHGCPGNINFIKVVDDWCRICDRLYIWDYSQNYHFYVPPYFNFSVMRKNMRYYAEHGARGMYPEGNPNSKTPGEFGELRCYLMAKLMWDPYMSDEEYYRHMDEFLAAYYGKGWRYIRSYLDSIIGIMSGHCMGGIHPSEYLRRDRLEVMAEYFEDWWNKAEELAGDRLEAVKRSRLQWEFLRLDLYPDEEAGRKFEKAIRDNEILWREDMRNLIENPPERYSMSPYTWYWEECDPFGNKVPTVESEENRKGE